MVNPRSFVIDPEEKTVWIVSEENKIAIFDITNKEKIVKGIEILSPFKVFGMLLSTDGNTLYAATEKIIFIYDVSDKTKLTLIKKYDTTYVNSWRAYFHFSPDHSRVIWGNGFNKEFWILELATDKIYAFSSAYSEKQFLKDNNTLV